MAAGENICKLLLNRNISDKYFSCNKLACDRLADKSKLLYTKNLVAHYGCVNAIEFNNNGQLLTSGGDDRRVLLWNTQKALFDYGKPVAMSKEHLSNIFCLAFDNNSTHIYSGGNDDIVLVHDLHTQKCEDVFKHELAVYAVSIDPFNDNIFATAGEDGRILVFDRRSSFSDSLTVVESRSAYHSAVYNPNNSQLIATANCRAGAAIYDVRATKKELMSYAVDQDCMNVKWDRKGKKIAILRRRRSLALHTVEKKLPLAVFFHPHYTNSCTMKSCYFAGLNDEYIITGSDDFNLYMWKVPDFLDSANVFVDQSYCRVLKGHRSIVNQVRFHREGCIIASSGVEKIIKLWSPMPMPNATQDPGLPRQRYTRGEYFSLFFSGRYMTHDYSTQSTEEDPSMLAFFDSLVAKEEDDSHYHSDPGSISSRIANSWFNSDEDDEHEDELSSLTEDGTDTDTDAETDDDESAITNEASTNSKSNAVAIPQVNIKHFINYSDTDEDSSASDSLSVPLIGPYQELQKRSKTSARNRISFPSLLSSPSSTSSSSSSSSFTTSFYNDISSSTSNSDYELVEQYKTDSDINNDADEDYNEKKKASKGTEKKQLKGKRKYKKQDNRSKRKKLFCSGSCHCSPPSYKDGDGNNDSNSSNDSALLVSHRNTTSKNRITNEDDIILATSSDVTADSGISTSGEINENNTTATASPDGKSAVSFPTFRRNQKRSYRARTAAIYSSDESD